MNRGAWSLWAPFPSSLTTGVAAARGELRAGREPGNPSPNEGPTALGAGRGASSGLGGVVVPGCTEGPEGDELRCPEAFASVVLSGAACFSNNGGEGDGVVGLADAVAGFPAEAIGLPNSVGIDEVPGLVGSGDGDFTGADFLSSTPSGGV